MALSLGNFFKRRKKYEALDPDEIFLDSTNLPEFDQDQFEGRIEKPIKKRSIYLLAAVFALFACVYIFQLTKIQVSKGEYYREIAENNRLHNSIIFGERGVITDKNGELLAWNVIDAETPDFVKREYRNTPGTSLLLGYVKYPKKDKFGFYYNTEYSGEDGVEKYYSNLLAGENGLKISETDALGKVITNSVVRPEKKGETIKLSVDVDIQEALYKIIQNTAKKAGYVGGSAAIMDLNTGEMLAAVSYPEYNSNVMTGGKDIEAISSYQNNSAKPFIDRLSSGLYAPGSIIKPIFAVAALAEGIITPEKKILSTGQLKVPNPFKDGEFTIFKDWRVNGWTDIKEAIAVSSDIYFYQIGGGFENQKGLGITNIGKYSKMFGFGTTPVNNFFTGSNGVIPSPEWKAKSFNGEIWRLGDTYNTSIGQYGFQITPIQALRSISAIATDGEMIDPTVLHNSDSANKDFQKIPIIDSNIFKIVREGMRMTVTEGTAQVLNVPFIKIAAKTGTAQVGVSNQFINSSVVGFFPYDNPRYSYVIMMERSPVKNTIGASVVMRQLVDWMYENKPEYFGLKKAFAGTSTKSEMPLSETSGTSTVPTSSSTLHNLSTTSSPVVLPDIIETDEIGR